MRPNPPPLSVRSPSSGFGLTFLRGIGLGLGWVLWWLKRPIPCLVCASPSRYSPFPFTIGHLHFLWVLELLTRLRCWIHGARINSSCDFYGFNSFIFQCVIIENNSFLLRGHWWEVLINTSHNKLPTPHHTKLKLNVNPLPLPNHVSKLTPTMLNSSCIKDMPSYTLVKVTKL